VKLPLIAVALSAAVAAQQPKFTASVAVVRIDVSVTDDHGNVRGLQPADFLVTDCDKPQSISVAESADAALDLEMVAQTIPSITELSREQPARFAVALTAFLRNVGRDDRLGLIVAGAPPTRVRELSFGPPQFGPVVFTEATDAAPFDAMAAALGEFRQADRRRALVVFANGSDFRSTVGLELLATAAGRLGPEFVIVAAPVVTGRAGLVINVVGQGGADTTAIEVHRAKFPPSLELLAKRTGGFTVDLGDGDPVKLMADLMSRLRTQYVITYDAPGGSGWHPVSVTMKRKGLKATTREGYFVD
jgi:hypothetical protein